VGVPQNKGELLAAIDAAFDKLQKELVAIPPEIADECTLEGHARGSQMSVANLAAYLLGWNALVLKWLGRDAAGEPVDYPETGFNWSQLGCLAQKFYRDYEHVPYLELLQRLEAAKSQIVLEIEARSDADLYGRPWYDGKWTMGRMIQFNTSSPYTNARGRLRKWLKARGR